MTEGIHRKPKTNYRAYLYLAPILVSAAVFVYYPFLRTALYSVFTVSRTGAMTGFAGLENWRYMFSRREFSAAVSNTLKLTALNVPLTLLITVLLGRLRKAAHRASYIADTLLALPMAVSMSAAALIFKVLLNPTAGIVNQWLGVRLSWYEGADTALYSIVLLTVWMGIPYNFLVLQGAFRGVPADAVESAEMDGCGGVRAFFFIELPLAAPSIVYVVCTNTVLALMTSGPVMIITRGGPSRATTTLMYLMYTSGYASSNYSMAACVSIVTFLMTLVFTLVTLRGNGGGADA